MGYYLAAYLQLLLLLFTTTAGAARNQPLLLPQLSGESSSPPPPSPAPWPEQFHARVFMNFTSTGTLYITDLYYDWPNKRNINILHQQLDRVLHDVEWNNGTSFYFTLGPQGTCNTIHFPVGILRPDFLGDATYLGREEIDGGFLCDVWTKVDFIWYYEDVATRRPVRWDFFDGISTHVMTFEEGVVLEDSRWQAPSYCFPEEQQYESRGEMTDFAHLRMRTLSALSC